MSKQLSGPYDDGYHAGYRAATTKSEAELTALWKVADAAKLHDHITLLDDESRDCSICAALADLEKVRG